MQKPLPVIDPLLNPDHPKTSTPPWAAPQPDTTPKGVVATALQGVPSIADVFDCAARHHPHFAQWRSPHGLLAGKSQST